MSKINNLKIRLSEALTNNDDELADLILNFFNKEFSEQDYLHILRQERWKFGIYCPSCQSSNIKKESESPTEHRFKYLCLDCNTIFEDDSGTPISGSMIPLQIWIQCWYLSQYCSSLQYIADRLEIDVNTIISMIQSLQHLFKSESLPLNIRDKINNATASLFAHQKRQEEEKEKKKEMLFGDTSKQAFDTGEYRKRKTRNKITNINKKNIPNV